MTCLSGERNMTCLLFHLQTTPIDTGAWLHVIVGIILVIIGCKILFSK